MLLLPPNRLLSKSARSPALAEVVVLEEVLDVVDDAPEAWVVPDGEVVEVAAAATELATPVAPSDALAAGAVEAAAVLSAATGTETERMGVGVEAAPESAALAAPVSEPAADVSAGGAVVEAAGGAVDAAASLGAFAAAAVVVLTTLVETISAAAPWTMPEDEPFPAAGEPTAKLASAAAVAIVEKTRIAIVEVIHTRTKDPLRAATTSNCRIRRVKDERRESKKRLQADSS